MDRYLEEKEAGVYRIVEPPCLFLMEDGVCQIESCKPQCCREFPYTGKPGRLFSLYSIIDSASVCPVVFEILERLKKRLRFGRKKRW